MFSLDLISGPAVEPVTLAEAKLWLRVDQSDEDALISDLITTARISVEEEINRQLITATWRLAMDWFGFNWTAANRAGTNLDLFGLSNYPIELPRPPLQSVTSVTYYDTAGVLQTLPVTAYQVTTVPLIAQILPTPWTFWPLPQLGRAGAVQVTYVAGYGGSAGSVPTPIKQAIKWRVLLDYGRDPDLDPANVQKAISDLISPYWAKSYR